jgi:hypothetical protein
MGGMFSQIIWKQAWSGDAESVLRQALASQRQAVRELSSQQWEASTATIGGIRDDMTSYVGPVSSSWSSVTLHLNSLLAEPVAAELSRLTSAPAIAILEYDQAAWGYSLYDRGELLDRFWNLPDVVETPPEECAGNASTVAGVFGVSAESISAYIHHVTEADYETKAFDDDEYALGDHWVRVDFMRRLGIPYPSPGQAAGGRYVQIQEARR